MSLSILCDKGGDTSSQFVDRKGRVGQNYIPDERDGSAVCRRANQGVLVVLAVCGDRLFQA